jgi:hypothetical protein
LPVKKPEPPAPKKLNFKQAFAQARKSGAKEFTWNGKRYNTKLKEENQINEYRFNDPSLVGGETIRADAMRNNVRPAGGPQAQQTDYDTRIPIDQRNALNIRQQTVVAKTSKQKPVTASTPRADDAKNAAIARMRAQRQAARVGPDAAMAPKTGMSPKQAPAPTTAPTIGGGGRVMGIKTNKMADRAVYRMKKAKAAAPSTTTIKGPASTATISGPLKTGYQTAKVQSTSGPTAGRTYAGSVVNTPATQKQPGNVKIQNFSAASNPKMVGGRRKD